MNKPIKTNQDEAMDRFSALPQAILGIDISKDKFDVALLKSGKFKTTSFCNNAKGFEVLSKWLEKQGLTIIHACLEATGSYGDALCFYLTEQRHIVSLVNPLRIKGFAQSLLSRTKTDKADAQIIARFCEAMKPEAWVPPSDDVRLLQALVRRLQALQSMQRQERNRLDVAHPAVKHAIQSLIEHLERDIHATRQMIRQCIEDNSELRTKRDLLDSIPGIGEATLNVILAMLTPADAFENAKQLAAYIGLTPRIRQSGSSVRGKAMMSKTGDTALRKALYMPALVACRFNPTLAHFSARLGSAGKPKMVIIGAVMRKLVHIIYDVLKSKKPFSPEIGLFIA